MLRLLFGAGGAVAEHLVPEQLLERGDHGHGGFLDADGLRNGVEGDLEGLLVMGNRHGDALEIESLVGGAAGHNGLHRVGPSVT
jgi:hypothetical protein